MKKEYEAIIHMKRPESLKHKPMDLLARAAQFAPFAALTGYGDSIDEAVRYTDLQRELNEDELAALDMKFALLKPNIESHPEITVTRFTADKRKSGGAYITTTGCLRRIDEGERLLIFTDGQRIRLEDICDVEEVDKEE